MKAHTYSFRDQRGAALVLVVVSLFALIGVGALAVDVAAWQVTRSELQKAADAGALEGARNLYLQNGRAVNPGANALAEAAAERNTSWATAVEVGGADVQRGHWSFGLGDLAEGFSPNNSLAALDLANLTEVELDENQDFINAVRVVARRQDTRFPLLFSRLFFQEGFAGQREAVAYLGYAGNVDRDEIDYPLMLCESVVRPPGGTNDCRTGRILSSEQTAKWTNYEQPCAGAANAKSVSNQMSPCGTGNSEAIFFGEGITTTRGVQAGNVDTLRDCWLAANLEKQAVSKAKGKGTTDFPAEPWRIKLLVVDCENATPICAETTGVVATNVLWITNPQNESYVPTRMAGIPAADGGDQVGSWASNTADAGARWAEFAQHFDLRDESGNLATLGGFSVYMHPDCDYVEPTGGTGGLNYGVLARVPVLVR